MAEIITSDKMRRRREELTQQRATGGSQRTAPITTESDREIDIIPAGLPTNGVDVRRFLPEVSNDEGTPEQPTPASEVAVDPMDTSARVKLTSMVVPAPTEQMTVQEKVVPQPVQVSDGRGFEKYLVRLLMALIALSGTVAAVRVFWMRS